MIKNLFFFFLNHTDPTLLYSSVNKYCIEVPQEWVASAVLVSMVTETSLIGGSLFRIVGSVVLH